MMFKSLVALAILSAMSAPVAAQTAPARSTPTTEPAQPAKPQMIKKRVCEQVDEDPYSRLGNRKICKTMEVPATSGGSSNGQQAPAQDPNQGN
jgi:hypothetical protein